MRELVLIVALLVPGVAWAEGWVMILPPTKWEEASGTYSTPSVVLDAPMSKWKYFSAYDTAVACEQAKSARSRALGAEAASCNVEDLICRAGIGAANQQLEARCVPYDLWWSSQQSSGR